MFRVSLFSLVVAIFLSLVGSVGVAPGQDKDKKKEEPKDILGKSVGEWIKILRTHENPKWRRAALIALDAGDAARTTALPALLAAIEKDEDPMVRQEAVMLLGRLGPKTNGAMKALAAALQNDKADAVREAAATAMGKEDFRQQAADYITALMEGLKDPHVGTRVAVAGALRDLGKSAEPAFPALFETAKNPKEDPLVRAAALHVVSRYGSDDPKAVPSKTVPLLVDLLKSSDTPSGLREVAAEGLGRSASDSAEVVSALCQTLTDKSLELRKASAIALGALGAKAKSGWPTVKDRLEYKLEKDGTRVVVEADSSVRNHLVRVAGTLGKTNNEAIKVLTDVAKVDRSTENRIAAIQELGELGSLAKSAVPELTKIAEDDARAAIRDAASKAIKLISK